MASVADLVQPATLERLASPAALVDGDSLARDGAVHLTTFGPLTVAARVGNGSAPVASLVSAVGELRWSCTCALARGGAFCAHLVATARVIWEQSPARR